MKIFERAENPHFTLRLCVKRVAHQTAQMRNVLSLSQDQSLMFPGVQHNKLESKRLVFGIGDRFQNLDGFKTFILPDK